MKPVPPPSQRRQASPALSASVTRRHVSTPLPVIARHWAPVAVFTTQKSGVRSADVIALDCDMEQKSTPLCPYLFSTR